MRAVQGPESATHLDALLDGLVSPLRRFGAAELLWQGERVLASRTGYSGEDGFERFQRRRLGGLPGTHEIERGIDRGAV